MTEQGTTTAATNDLGLSRDQLLEMAYYMRFARALEEKLTALFRQGKVIGGLYRSLGQEGRVRRHFLCARLQQGRHPVASDPEHGIDARGRCQASRNIHAVHG